jgi:hypothetical protein
LYVLIPVSPDPIGYRLSNSIYSPLSDIYLDFNRAFSQAIFYSIRFTVFSRIFCFYQSIVDKVKGDIKMFDKIKEKRQIKKAMPLGTPA